MPQLMIDSELEKHGRNVYTHKNFYIFQEELWSCCVDCVITKLYEDDGIKEFTIQNYINYIYTVKLHCTIQIQNYQASST